jgi:hypothetical protein
MTEIEYRSANGINKSALWEIRKSPLHFKWALEHPQEPTPALVFGGACHKFVLEPATFGDEYAVLPQIDRRTKDGKALYMVFVESADGKQVVTSDEMGQIVEMQAALMQNPIVRVLLNGAHEIPMFWTDDRTGEPCKGRLDARIADPAVLVDYKTTDDASTESFMRSAVKYGYDVQAAHYLRGAKSTFGTEHSFVFIAQEKKPPYAVNIMQASEAFIERGTRVLMELMDIYHGCKESGNWYGYEGAENIVNDLTIPAWAGIE